MEKVYEGRESDKAKKALDYSLIEAIERCEHVARELGIKFKGFAEDTNMFHVTPFYTIENYKAIFEKCSEELRATAVRVKYEPSLDIRGEHTVTIYVASVKELIHELKDP